MVTFIPYFVLSFTTIVGVLIFIFFSIGEFGYIVLVIFIIFFVISCLCCLLLSYLNIGNNEATEKRSLFSSTTFKNLILIRMQQIEKKVMNFLAEKKEI